MDGILEKVEKTDRWKNRRKMAWICIIAALTFPLLILASESPTLGQIAFPFYGFVAGVVMTYIGGAVVDDHWQKKDSRYDRPETFTDSYRR